MCRSKVLAALLLCAAVAAAGGVVAWVRVSAERGLRAELAQAERDYSAGRHATARQRVARLAERWPGRAEVEFRLGICEEALGRPEAALAAWSRVPPRSPFGPKAAALRATTLINQGRYAPAEAVLDAAPRRGGPDEHELRRVLIRLLRFEGRTHDVRAEVRASWPLAPDPVALLKELWLLDSSPVPVEALSRTLASAGDDDDRVWLGRANLAVTTGRLDEADSWLGKCLHARPNDAAVWRAVLDLAVASDDTGRAWEALTHLPPGAASEGEVLGLRAWWAALRCTADLQRRVLREWLDADPSSPEALERLAALDRAAGRTAEAVEWQRRKAEIDRTKDRYRKALLYDTNLVDQAATLSRLAADLGRTFDARAWAQLRDGGRPAPLPTGPTTAAQGGTLADRLADLRDAGGPAPDRAAGNPSNATRPEFRDDAESAGLAFVFDNGRTSLRELFETMSGGVGLLDYDGDGWLDVYAVQGGPTAPDAPPDRDGDRLFRNRGDGTFEDVTEASRVATFPRDYGMGVAVGDYDNDGHPDLFVSRLRSYALYRNRGDGTFEDVTRPAGLGGPRSYPSSAAFADLDGDGDLDLYVCHYMLLDPAHPPVCKDDKGNYLYCDPSRVQPAPDHVFRNDAGRFTDVTEESGCLNPGGRGLGVVAADVDDDGKVDLYVANDGTANFLFRNLGGFRFEEVGASAGVAGNAEGGYQAGMGVACGDLNGDARPDLLVTNFYGEGATAYQNLGRGVFTDSSARWGVKVATTYLLGFGAAVLDFDNDGRPDVMMANGHVNDSRPYFPYAMPALLLAGDGRGRLVDVSNGAGPPWEVPRIGRGLAVGDLDNDGRVDALLVAQTDPMAYFHNRTAGGRSLTLRLEGTASNRDAVGARVTLVAGGRRQVAWRLGGGSYQSASDPRLHFGLGTAPRADSVEVRWPSGRLDRHNGLAADTGYLLREGSRPLPLPGFPAATPSPGAE